MNDVFWMAPLREAVQEWHRAHPAEQFPLESTYPADFLLAAIEAWNAERKVTTQ